jgi:hypothetical protein
MKLHELSAHNRSEQIAKIFESHLGGRIDFNRFAPAHARQLLTKVRALVREHQSTPKFYTSENNPAYLKLVMMEQALVSKIEEMEAPMIGIDMNDPKTKQIMDKAGKGQNLTPDEQKVITAVATMKKEGAKTGMKRMVKESELQQAQVVLAAQDMIDRVQKMTEEISEMQFKDLPALADSIKNDPAQGPDKASQFQATASGALSTLLTSVQQGKTELEAAQNVLTGQAPSVPGQDDLGLPPGGAAEPDDSMDNLDIDADAEIDIDADAALVPPDDEPVDNKAALGRGRR